MIVYRKMCFRPLIRGFFFYLVKKDNSFVVTGFRPLIRGFFFYEKELADYSAGIRSFRPLIRGFFFY